MGYRIVTAFCLAMFAPLPVAAQDLIAEYFTTIGPRDLYNSAGQRLTDFCSIVQQDRANYHRFGRRDEGDNGDPIFSDKAARARIPGRCRVLPGSEYIPSVVLRGDSRFIWVRVYGRGRTPDLIEISEGAG